MEILKLINLALRFVLELCSLATMGYWGFTVGKGSLLKVLLAIGAPLLLAVVWGAFGSPKAPIVLSPPFHFLLEVFVFGLPAILLFFIGKSTTAWIFVATFIINRLLMFVWGQ